MKIVNLNNTVEINSKRYALFYSQSAKSETHCGLVLTGKEVKKIWFLNFGLILKRKPIYFLKPLKSLMLEATLRILTDFDGKYVNVWWHIKNAPNTNGTGVVDVIELIGPKHKLFSQLEELKNFIKLSKN